jgi:membrane-associated phospholipid phosphatase
VKTAFARAVSIAAHPFVTSIAVVAAGAFRSAPRAEAMKVVAAFALVAVLPVLLLSWRQVRRGAWEHIDASNRRERPLLYAIGIGSSALLFVYLLLAHPRSHFVRSIPIVIAVLAACGLANRWVKISLHVLFAALAASVVLAMRSPLAWLLVPAVPLVMWSRLVLARHTALEVLLGAVIGAATGFGITR